MPDVALRPAEERDLELLLAWRNHPDLYRWFHKQHGELTWEAHVDWFENRHPDRRDWLIEYDGRRVGSVWITEENEVGIYVGEVTLWGKGVGRAALEALIDEVDELGALWAGMDTENTRSHALFEAVGFERIGSRSLRGSTEADGDRVYYEYAPGGSR